MSLLQIDLRYADPKQGDVIVVVAPVLRFKDVGFNANVTLEDLGQSFVIHTLIEQPRQPRVFCSPPLPLPSENVLPLTSCLFHTALSDTTLCATILAAHPACAAGVTPLP